MSADGREREYRFPDLPSIGRSQLIAFPTPREDLNNLREANLILMLGADMIPSLGPTRIILTPIRTRPEYKLSKRLLVVIEDIFPQILQILDT